jgi:hypothetical protein
VYRSGDADAWLPRPSLDRAGLPEPGWLVGWRYAVWRVVDCRLREEVDWSDADRQRMAVQASWEPERRRPPYVVVLAHVRGPLLVRRLVPDGTYHLGVPAGSYRGWAVVRERFAVCSCHGEPWPCRAEVHDHVVARAAADLEEKLAGLAPGVCAACHQPIGRRKAITFSEPHAEVPGAPGPTFHLGGRCRAAAIGYETGPRLATYPGAERLLSCPGRMFRHQLGGRRDCSAGSACTGHHLPGERTWCGCHTYNGLGPNDWIRPATRCGFEGCTGRS